MARVAEPLLLAVAALLPTAACAAAILALISNFKTAGDDEYYYLSGVKGPLFLLLASLSVLISLLNFRTLNSLFLYLQAWLVIRRADALRSSYESDSQQTVGDKSRRVHASNDAIALLNGKFWSPRKAFINARRGDSNITTRSPIFSCLLALLLAALFVLLLVADIWLHITIQVNNISTSQSSTTNTPNQAFGRALSSTCTTTAQSSGSWQVTLNNNFCQSRMDLMQNDTEAYATLPGSSTMNGLVTIPRGFEGQDIAVITDPVAGSPTTYAASSYGVSTTCKPVPGGCSLNATIGQYNCSASSYAGYVTQQPTYGTPSLINGVTTFPVAMILSSVDNFFSDSLSSSATAVSADNDSLFIALSCTSQALEVTYLSQSGTLQAQSVEPADDTTQWLVLAPMFPGQVSGYDSFGASQLMTAMETAISEGTPNSVGAFADEFASAFSEAAIASSAGIVVPSSFSGSTGGSTISGSVTLLPKEPILMVVALNFIYVLLAFILGIAALVLSLRDERISHIRSLLTLQGALAAALKHEQGASGGGSSKSLKHSGTSLGRSGSQTSSRPAGKDGILVEESESNIPTGGAFDNRARSRTDDDLEKKDQYG